MQNEKQTPMAGHNGLTGDFPRHWQYFHLSDAMFQVVVCSGFSDVSDPSSNLNFAPFLGLSFGCRAAVL